MKKYIALLLLILPALGIAQSRAEKRADKMFDRLAYVRAAELYTRIAVKNGNDHVYERLGDCYRLMGQVSQSEPWYGKVAQGKSPTPESVLHYAEALRSNGKYAESEPWMTKYYGMKQDDARAKMYAENLGYTAKILAEQPYFELKTLDVNSPQADFGTAFFKGQVVFASSRTPKVSVQNVHMWNNQPYLNLYVANRDGSGNLAGVNPLAEKLNTRYHEGPACFSADGKTLYFTRNNYFKKHFGTDKSGINNLKIFRAVNAGGTWKEENLSINSDEYSIGHPALSPDGKYLYFTSDMPGGKGMTDIYRSSLSPDGTVGAPENLGASINTEGKEMFPFLDAKGNLFFASDGQLGLGGLDIFYAPVADGTFGKVMNPGVPVNSSRDDFALTLDSVGNGYLSSNREGGKGDDDIYSVSLIRPLRTTFLVKGIVKDKLSKEALPFAQVILKDAQGNAVDTVTADASGAYQFEVEPSKNYVLGGNKEKYFNGAATFNTNDLEEPEVVTDVLLEKDPGLSLYFLVKDKVSTSTIQDVKIKITDKLTGKTDSVFSSLTGDYRIPLTGKKLGDQLTYTIAFEKQGYLSKSIVYDAGIFKEGEIRIEESLDKIDVGLDLAKIIDIKPIYFDLGKSIIRPDAAIELDKIVKVMNENPNMVVELGSHTDCRSSAQSNMSLSERRAKASADYIKKRITNPDRIYGKGYGETQLTNGCECEGVVKSTCPEDEHQKNRRTEFKIIKM
ncbi:MAG TPA: OmpA family protein [Bacteroidia bacterium]|nr:OmpA family protein [Bacteroidia bacterium]